MSADAANARGSSAAKRVRRAGEYRTAERELYARYGLDPVERRLELSGLAGHVRVNEHGAGEPVLFLHGAPNAGAVWVPLVGGLRERRCIVADRPGCGLSEPLPRRLWRRPSETVVAVLDALLDALGLERVPLVASSLGGAWALLYASSRPERVSALVLEGCPALVTGMETPRLMRWYAASGIHRFIAAARIGPRTARRLLTRNGHQAAVRDDRIPHEYFRWNAALFSHTRTAWHDFELMSIAVSWSGIRRAYRIREPLLSAIRCPTLMLWGDRDPFGSPDVGRRLARLLPRADLHVFHDSGHMPWLDAPADHAARVSAFLEGR